MKKVPFILFLVASLSLASCRSKPMKVERRLENGIEVVINHVTSRRLREIHQPLRLEELFVIDTENAEVAQLGITDIEGFDVNSAGEIFIFKSVLNQGDFIYKFDATGHFVASFGRKGMGPGELQSPLFQKINAADELYIMDAVKSRMLLFDRQGKVLREIPTKLRLRTSDALISLDNGHYLHRRIDLDPTRTDAKTLVAYSIVDGEFSEIHELDRLWVDNADQVKKFLFPFPFIRWAVSGPRIFLANDTRGYEIRSYDLNGDLLKKVRKEGPAVKFPEIMKKEVLKIIEAPPFAFLKGKIEFMDPAPPDQHFWADDEGRLYVVTYEQGTGPGEFLIDIFDRVGVFVGQMSLNIFISMNPFSSKLRLDSWTTMKKNRFYFLRQKESGYLQLVVYRMTWTI